MDLNKNCLPFCQSRALKSTASKYPNFTQTAAESYLTLRTIICLRPNCRKYAEAGEAPMKSCFGCSELEFMLQKYDFLIYEFLNDKEIETKFFGGCQEDLHAFAHINYAHAVLHKNL